MAGSDDNLGIQGGTEPQTGASYADEEAAMNSGKGRMMAGIIATCVVVVAGFVFLMMQGGAPEGYRELGKAVNGANIKGNFDGFWGCALQNVNLRDLKAAEAMIAQIDMRGADGRGKYAKHVDSNCVPKLSEMQTKLDILVVPQELQGPITGMKEASGKLRSSWSSYIAYLTDSKAEYDDGEARDRIKEIARGWYEFKKGHSELNKILIEKLE